VLEPCRLSLLSERRSLRPRGLRGGEDGAAGRNLLNGEPLPAKASVELAEGDLLRVETPGGGGYLSEADI
jgi:N-methylhydantoinase B/oxoprolinase/acetone carboxylase alpha subunit